MSLFSFIIFLIFLAQSDEYEKYHEKYYAELKYKNPFLSRLNNDADIKPKRARLFNDKSLNSKLSGSGADGLGLNECDEYAHKNFNNVRVMEFSDMRLEEANLEIYYEEGKEKINLNYYIQFLTHFFCNYSPLEFPVFCLNFDYMRVLSSLLQNKLEDFLNAYSSLDNLYIDIKSNYEKLQKKVSENPVKAGAKAAILNFDFKRSKANQNSVNSANQLFPLNANIYNSNTNNNFPKYNPNKEYNNSQANINPEFYADNYNQQNIKNLQDLELANFNSRNIDINSKVNNSGLSQISSGLNNSFGKETKKIFIDYKNSSYKNNKNIINNCESDSENIINIINNSSNNNNNYNNSINNINSSNSNSFNIVGSAKDSKKAKKQKNNKRYFMKSENENEQNRNYINHDINHTQEKKNLPPKIYNFKNLRINEKKQNSYNNSSANNSHNQTNPSYHFKNNHSFTQDYSHNFNAKKSINTINKLSTHMLNDSKAINKTFSNTDTRPIYYHTFSNCNDLNDYNNSNFNSNIHNNYNNYDDKIQEESNATILVGNANNKLKNLLYQSSEFKDKSADILDNEKLIINKNNLNIFNNKLADRIPNQQENPINRNRLMNINNTTSGIYNSEKYNINTLSDNRDQKELNIRDKLIINLTGTSDSNKLNSHSNNKYNNNSNSNNIRISDINELSTLQSNEYRVSGSLNNLLGSNAYSSTRAPNIYESKDSVLPDKAATFIQSLDSELNYDYLNRINENNKKENLEELEKIKYENFMLYNSEKSLNQNNMKYNHQNDKFLYNKNINNTNQKPEFNRDHFYATNKFNQNHNHNRIVDAYHILVYFIKAYFSRILFEKLKLNYNVYKLKKFVFLLKAIIRQKEKNFKKEFLEKLDFIGKFEEKLFYFMRIKERNLKQRIFYFLTQKMWKKKLSKFLRVKLINKRFIKALKNCVRKNNLKNKQTELVKEFYEKILLKKAFFLIRSNIKKFHSFANPNYLNIDSNKTYHNDAEHKNNNKYNVSYKNLSHETNQESHSNTNKNNIISSNYQENLCNNESKNKLNLNYNYNDCLYKDGFSNNANNIYYASENYLANFRKPESEPVYDMDRNINQNLNKEKINQTEYGPRNNYANNIHSKLNSNLTSQGLQEENYEKIYKFFHGEYNANSNNFNTNKDKDNDYNLNYNLAFNQTKQEDQQQNFNMNNINNNSDANNNNSPFFNFNKRNTTANLNSLDYSITNKNTSDAVLNNINNINNMNNSKIPNHNPISITNNLNNNNHPNAAEKENDTNLINLIDYSKLTNNDRENDIEKEDFETSHEFSENLYRHNYEYSKKLKNEESKSKNKSRTSLLNLNNENSNKPNELLLDNLLNKLKKDYKNLSKLIVINFLCLIKFFLRRQFSNY